MDLKWCPIKFKKKTMQLLIQCDTVGIWRVELKQLEILEIIYARFFLCPSIRVL